MQQSLLCLRTGQNPTASVAVSMGLRALPKIRASGLSWHASTIQWSCGKCAMVKHPHRLTELAFKQDYLFTKQHYFLLLQYDMSITTETNHPQPQAQPIPPAGPAYPTTVTQRRPNDYEQGSGQLTGAGAGQYAGSGQYTGAGQSLGSGQFHGIVIALCTVVSSVLSVSELCLQLPFSSIAPLKSCWEFVHWVKA